MPTQEELQDFLKTLRENFRNDVLYSEARRNNNLNIIEYALEAERLETKIYDFIEKFEMIPSSQNTEGVNT